VIKIFGLAMAMLVLHAPGLAAQTALAAPMDPRLIVAPAELVAAPVLADARRDHVAGAIKGLALGALIGGVGFAIVTAAANDDSNGRQGYTVLAVPVGAVVGGAVGLVAGAIIGAPEKSGRRGGS
jgi:peptidoglycan/LPS O-acetylase OafA/YrhL